MCILSGSLLMARKLKDANKKREMVENLLSQLEEHCNTMLHNNCFSRALQACLKDGDTPQRARIWKMLQGKMKEISLDRHSHKLAIKLFLYGSKAVRETIAKIVTPDADIFFSKFGARVWEYLYCQNIPISKQKEMLYSIILPKLLYVKFPNVQTCKTFIELRDSLDIPARTMLHEHLSKLIQRAIDKELLDKVPVHTLLKYFSISASEEQLLQCMDRISEGAIHMSTTRDGVEALSRFYGYATAKQRKLLVRNLKGKVVEMANNSVDHYLLLRILSSTDDTKLLSSSIIKEIADSLDLVSSNKYGHKILLQMLSPMDRRYLNDFDRQFLQFPSPTSMKDSDKREAELKSVLLSKIEVALRCQSDKRSSSKVFLEYLKATQDSTVVKLLLEQIEEELNLMKEGNIFDDSVAHRSLSLLVRQSKNYPLQTSAGIPFEIAFWNAMQPHVAKMLSTRGVFILLELLNLQSDSDQSKELRLNIQNEITDALLQESYAEIDRKGGKSVGLRLLEEKLPKSDE
ncbi:hypothetical protein IE077_003806 [Cardiosporidium cionae]|uniref:PUM-HD domain-containing protein n=1 Tax=Cardiosporidium cionae TaxID=476202 RepID=A0ABQ7JEI3_9APIC|nr:hypothetical protein IE077_003806 [Cardiosporidium cionae]|eukprot:KAF8822422.1 hypothetical protein IE077_003806 [Cardiosporidium cionae]